MSDPDACEAFGVAARDMVAKLDPDDDEVAHSIEDDLMAAALQHISEEQCRQPSVCASLGLLTATIEFCRWHA